ncbi:hypothetical protein ACET3Z_018572 [Daucus carota]
MTLLDNGCGMTLFNNSSGPNDFGQMWGGTENPRKHPKKGQNQVIRQVARGVVHLVVLSGDGLLQAWGCNEFGRLGRGVTCEGLQGAHVIKAYAKFLDETPQLVKITQVSCGENYSAAISDNHDSFYI